VGRMLFEVSFRDFISTAPWAKDGFAVVEVETLYRLKYKGINQPIWCRPDYIMANPEGDIIIGDHKTTSFNPRDVACVYPYSVQPRIEHLCVAAARKEVGRVYFLHNVIRKPTIRPGTKKNPDFDSYLSSCHEWYDLEYARDPDNPPCLQSMTLLPYNPMSQEFHTILAEAAYACRCNADPSRFYRNEGSCMGKFGNSSCPYLSLCKSSPPAWPDLIERQYEIYHREDDEEEGERV